MEGRSTKKSLFHPQKTVTKWSQWCGNSLLFVPDLCQIEVKPSKNKHKQIKPNKNWNFMEINELRCNTM
jgi:hypothetical protein